MNLSLSPDSLAGLWHYYLQPYSHGGVCTPKKKKKDDNFGEGGGREQRPFLHKRSFLPPPAASPPPGRRHQPPAAASSRRFCGEEKERELFALQKLLLLSRTHFLVWREQILAKCRRPLYPPRRRSASCQHDETLWRINDFSLFAPPSFCKKKDRRHPFLQDVMNHDFLSFSFSLSTILQTVLYPDVKKQYVFSAQYSFPLFLRIWVAPVIFSPAKYVIDWGHSLN